MAKHIVREQSVHRATQNATSFTTTRACIPAEGTRKDCDGEMWLGRTSAKATWGVGEKGVEEARCARGEAVDARRVDGDGCREAVCVNADPGRPTADAGSPYSNRRSNMRRQRSNRMRRRRRLLYRRQTMQVLVRQLRHRLSSAGCRSGA